jgi:molecular chaperone GrpE
VNNEAEKQPADGVRPEPEAGQETEDAVDALPEGEPEEGAEDLPADPERALAEAQQQLADKHDAVLRMRAEMENLRKRLVRDLERSRRFALERMMGDLLPVWDSLERGLETDGESATVESLKEGKALIKKMLGKVMQDHGLSVIDPLGEPFDPDYHEAMTMLPSDEYEADRVMEVLQKGFQLHDRLLRPAMVVVSTGPRTD